MPRLFHRPSKYRSHRSTQQAVVSLRGQVIFLGPYGSKQSHAKYQEVLKLWQTTRHEETCSTDAPKSSVKEAIVASGAVCKSRSIICTSRLRWSQEYSLTAPLTMPVRLAVESAANHCF